MPFIGVNFNREITKEKEEVIKSNLGQIIMEIPGKTEDRLMLQFNDNCRMWFGGDNSKPIAFIKVEVYGTSEVENYQAFSDRLISLLVSELQIDKSDIYVNIEENFNWFFAR